MEEQLAALLASEEEILVSLHSRLVHTRGQHIFLPALQAAPIDPPAPNASPADRPADSETTATSDQKGPEQNNEVSDSEAQDQEILPFLGRLVRACEEQYLFTKGKRCPLCGRQQSSGSECGQCGTPMDGRILKKSIRVRRVALGTDDSGPTADELRPGGRRWRSVRIYDLLKEIGEKGFKHEEWRSGIVVRNSRIEYRLEWEGAWYLLRKDGMKMLETGSHHELVKGLWKLWKKGGAYATTQ